MDPLAQTYEKPRFLNDGIKFMMFSTFSFSLMNVFIKKLAHIPAMEVVFFRCLVSSIICFIGIHKARVDWRGSNNVLLFLRGASGTTALFFFFLTVQNLPLGSATTIAYLSPIFTTILAIFILNENVRAFQWLFFAISFIGIFVIKGFDSRIETIYLFTGIGSAFFSGIAYNLVRTMKEKEHLLVVVLHFQLVGVVAGFLISLFYWQTPVGIDWLYLLLVGVTTQLGQVNLTKALSYEKVANVSIVNYTGIIYALFFGWFVFGETYTLQTTLGIVIVISGVILSIIFTKRDIGMIDDPTVG